MKKKILCFASAMLMFSCSHEDSVSEPDIDKEVKTVTPAVGYISPYDINSVNPLFAIVFINNTNYNIDYRLATIAAFFDGKWDGIIDYTPYGGPILTPVNAPILLNSSPNEYAIDGWAESINSPANSVVNIDINSLSFSGRPYTPSERNFLKTFSKLLHVHVIFEGMSNMFLKHDVPPSFTNMNSLPPIMNANNYEAIPGVSAYNLAISQPMGISVFHAYSRELIWPNMPNYNSEYFFTGSGGTALHLYFKTYPNHIEIVLQ